MDQKSFKRDHYRDLCPPNLPSSYDSCPVGSLSPDGIVPDYLGFVSRARPFSRWSLIVIIVSVVVSVLSTPVRSSVYVGTYWKSSGVESSPDDGGTSVQVVCAEGKGGTRGRDVLSVGPDVGEFPRILWVSCTKEDTHGGVVNPCGGTYGPVPPDRKRRSRLVEDRVPGIGVCTWEHFTPTKVAVHSGPRDPGG